MGITGENAIGQCQMLWVWGRKTLDLGEFWRRKKGGSVQKCLYKSGRCGETYLPNRCVTLDVGVTQKDS